jgi:hypothetical protein
LTLQGLLWGFSGEMPTQILARLFFFGLFFDFARIALGFFWGNARTNSGGYLGVFHIF